MRSAKGRLRLRVTLRFVCPFCGADAMMLEGGVALAHTLPMCAAFEALDVPAFLRALRSLRMERPS